MVENSGCTCFISNWNHEFLKCINVFWLTCLCFFLLQCPFQPNDNDCGYYVMKFIKDIVTHDQLEVPEFVSLLLHMTYIVLTYKIVVDLLFKVNCHINMFIMSINSVLWRLSIIKVIYGGGGWSHWRVVQVCFPYCSSYYPKFTSFLEFHTSKEEVGVWHFW